ncbi:hypothetical protein ACL02T_09650 [Pseudonocardia sp. RS010]|uniref:hypothetical protein n=1 Tax=Pseudonocardia sp. RS010 TaxID=3385979 RepID=UPI0039A1175D
MISAAQAGRLYLAASWFADTTNTAEDWLPQIVLPNPDLIARMVGVMGDLAERIAIAARLDPQNMAEQIALGAVITEAEETEADLEDASGPELAAWVRSLPGSHKLHGLYDMLLPDVDHDWLYDPGLDGIENEEAFVAVMGPANLRPGQWFEPFYRPA